MPIPTLKVNIHIACTRTHKHEARAEVVYVDAICNGSQDLLPRGEKPNFAHKLPLPREQQQQQEIRAKQAKRAGRPGGIDSLFDLSFHVQKRSETQQQCEGDRMWQGGMGAGVVLPGPWFGPRPLGI